MTRPALLTAIVGLCGAAWARYVDWRRRRERKRERRYWHKRLVKRKPGEKPGDQQ